MPANPRSPFLAALLLAGCASSRPPLHEDAVGDAGTPRQAEVVDLSLEVHTGGSELGAVAYDAVAVVGTVARPPTAQGRAEAGTCQYEDRLVAPLGDQVASSIKLDFGPSMRLRWDPQLRRHVASRGGDGRDMAWQPVSATASLGADWSLANEKVLQFGEAPDPVARRHRDTGDVSVWWFGEYGPQDVEVRVDLPNGQLRCSPGPERIVVPWWAAELPGARLWFAATRRERRLLDDGTVVIGRATQVVPLGQEQDQVLREIPGGWVPPALPVRLRLRWRTAPLTEVQESA